MVTEQSISEISVGTNADLYRIMVDLTGSRRERFSAQEVKDHLQQQHQFKQ